MLSSLATGTLKRPRCGPIAPDTLPRPRPLKTLCLDCTSRLTKNTFTHTRHAAPELLSEEELESIHTLDNLVAEYGNKSHKAKMGRRNNRICKFK